MFEGVADAVFEVASGAVVVFGCGAFMFFDGVPFGGECGGHGFGESGDGVAVAGAESCRVFSAALVVVEHGFEDWCAEFPPGNDLGVSCLLVFCTEARDGDAEEVGVGFRAEVCDGDAGFCAEACMERVHEVTLGKVSRGMMVRSGDGVSQMISTGVCGWRVRAW